MCFYHKDNDHLSADMMTSSTYFSKISFCHNQQCCVVCVVTRNYTSVIAPSLTWSVKIFLKDHAATVAIALSCLDNTLLRRWWRRVSGIMRRLTFSRTKSESLLQYVYSLFYIYTKDTPSSSSHQLQQWL